MNFTSKLAPRTITGADLMIADYSIPVTPEIETLIKKHNLHVGGKYRPPKEVFEEFWQEVKKSNIQPTPGGSAANTLVTLKRMLPEMNVIFYGITANDEVGKMLRTSLTDNGVTVLPPPESLAPQAGNPPMHARSVVLRYPDGDRITVTDNGNAKDYLTADVLKSDPSDIFLPFSLRTKLGVPHGIESNPTHTPNLPDMMSSKRWAAGTRMVSSLFTHSKLDPAEQQYAEWQACSSNVILSNGEELARALLENRDATQPVTALEEDMAMEKLHVLLEEKNALRNPEHIKNKEQVAFITLGKRGCAVITQDGIQKIPRVEIESKDIVNTVGAGDTAFGGFLAGYYRGLSHDISAKIGMRLAAEKLKTNQARLEYPLAILENTDPALSAHFSIRSVQTMR